MSREIRNIALYCPILISQPHDFYINHCFHYIYHGSHNRLVPRSSRGGATKFNLLIQALKPPTAGGFFVCRKCVSQKCRRAKILVLWMHSCFPYQLCPLPPVFCAWVLIFFSPPALLSTMQSRMHRAFTNNAALMLNSLESPAAHHENHKIWFITTS